MASAISRCVRRALGGLIDPKEAELRSEPRDGDEEAVYPGIA